MNYDTTDANRESVILLLEVRSYSLILTLNTRLLPSTYNVRKHIRNVRVRKRMLRVVDL